MRSQTSSLSPKGARLLLVRQHAWWRNKVPLSVTLVTLLLARNELRATDLLSLLLGVIVVSSVANYGYGLNELFDRDEDARAGRANVVAERGAGLVWLSTLASAVLALVLASYAAGVVGGFVTLIELALPATYSIPPFRTKERGWPAVVSDATAAHVYPAVLAVLVLAHRGGRPFALTMLIWVVIWGTATGLRGILSHLIWSFEHDQVAGLETLAHTVGARPLAALILTVLLPLEVLSFTAVAVLAAPGWAYASLLGLYLANEVRRSFSSATRRSFAGSYESRVFTTITGRYVPFVQERLYKVWGPVFGPVAAALTTGSPQYLIITALFLVLFKPNLRSLL